MVMNVRASVGGSGLTVTFDPITNPNEARGNVSYMVCYSLRGNTTQVCQTTLDSSITFPGTFSNIFAVTVTPVTAAGAGMASTAIEVGKSTKLCNKSYSTKICHETESTKLCNILYSIKL